MTTIEQLYYCYNVLSEAKDDAGKHTDEFVTIMKGATGNTSSKLLTLQFLPKFSKYFPQFLTQAFEYQLDLCEDNDINVRRQSVKHLLEYAKIDEKLFLKVADIFIQLGCIDDNVVCECAQKGIETLLSLDSLKVATAAITHLEETGEESVFFAVDTLLKIYSRKFPLSSNEEDITNFKTNLNEVLENCINNLHIKIPLDNLINVIHYNNLMLSFLILLNPSSTKLITPSAFVQKAVSAMCIVTDNLMSLNNLLDLVKMYKLVEPYLLADHTLVNEFIMGYVHLKLLPLLPTMNQSFQIEDPTEKQIFRILYVTLIQEIVILLTYLPVSAASGCVPLFLNLLSSVLPTMDKFSPQNNSYSDDTLIDSEVLGCYLLGFYYILYKNPTVDSVHQNTLIDVRSRLGILLRVINSGSHKFLLGSLKTMSKSISTDSSSNLTSNLGDVNSVETTTVVKPTESFSKHAQITPPSSPSPKRNKSRAVIWRNTESSNQNKRSAHLYAPPYKRASRPTTPNVPHENLNAIKLLVKALIDEPISKNVSLIPYWKSNKFMSDVRTSIVNCLPDGRTCRATSYKAIFKMVEWPKNNFELEVVGSGSFTPKNLSGSQFNGSSNTFSLKRQVRNKRGIEKVSPTDSNPKSLPVPKKRASKAGRGRGRRR